MSAFALLLGAKRTSSAPAPVVAAVLSTAICSGLPMPYLRAILSPWAPNRARPFTAHRSGQLQSGRQKRVRKPTGSPSPRGISACSAFRDRRSHRRRWAMRSMPGLAISKSGALAATRTRPLPSTSCGDRSARRSMSWSATCGARIAQRFAAIPTSAATLSRCDRRRFRRAIRRQHGGQGSGDLLDHARRSPSGET